MEQNPMHRSNYSAGRQINNNDLYDEEYDDIWPKRTSNSARRYRSDVRTTDSVNVRADVQPSAGNRYYSSYAGRKTTVPPRRTAGQTSPVTQQQSPARRRPATTEDIPSSRSKPLSTRRIPTPSFNIQLRLHWLVYVGAALLIMVLGWVVVSSVANWWQVTQDDWHYGRPRTFQTDEVVGHNDSPANKTHFIALNLKRHVEIIEFPGGDSSKARVYMGPTLIGPGQDLAPVTLSFQDTKHNGHPAMIVMVQDSKFVFVNENGTFRPLRPGETI